MNHTHFLCTAWPFLINAQERLPASYTDVLCLSATAKSSSSRNSLNTCSDKMSLEKFVRTALSVLHLLLSIFRKEYKNPCRVHIFLKILAEYILFNNVLKLWKSFWKTVQWIMFSLFVTSTGTRIWIHTTCKRIGKHPVDLPGAQEEASDPPDNI